MSTKTFTEKGSAPKAVRRVDARDGVAAPATPRLMNIARSVDASARRYALYGDILSKAASELRKPEARPRGAAAC